MLPGWGLVSLASTCHGFLAGIAGFDEQASQYTSPELCESLGMKCKQHVELLYTTCHEYLEPLNRILQSMNMSSGCKMKYLQTHPVHPN